MRAFAIDKPAEKGSLHDLPAPQLAPGTVRVRVTYAGVNPVDWKIREGRYGDPGPMPKVLGQDIAGVVEAVADDVNDFKPGDRVLGIARKSGGYAEQTLAFDHDQAQPLAVIPDGVSDEQAAALPTPALTALASLVVLGVTAGTTVAILGAAGAVGGFAVQMAKDRGARVIGTVSGNADEARALGADDVFDTKAGHDVYAAIKQKYANGVDAVLDLVSSDGDAIKKVAPILHEGGRLVSTNHVADEDWFKSQGIVATNIVMNETPQSSRAGLDQVTKMVLDGTITVRIAGTKPLAEAGDVLDGMKNHKLSGKYVLTISGET